MTEPRNNKQGLQRVLIAVDLTSVSDRALRRVVRLPLAHNAQLTLFHVVPDDLPVKSQELAVRDARRALREIAGDVRGSVPRGVRIDALVKVGNGAKQIAQTAKASGAELIVMGRGGGSALRDAFLGSTAERVIRLGQLPVLTVRLTARAPYQKPALALDFDDSTPPVVEWTWRLLTPPLPRITVIHALDTPHQGAVYPSLARNSGVAFDAELELKAGRKIAKVFAGADDALRWKPHVRGGSARLVIAKAVKRAETDLLVLGTRGHAGIAYVVLGTVAGDVLREVGCDVLIVPPRRTRPAKKRS